MRVAKGFALCHAPGVKYQEQHESLQPVYAVGILAVCINIVLMLVKISAGVLGNSYALVADGIESASDILTTLITWAGFHLSLQPPDDRHPFGHGKIEALAGIFSGMALWGAAVLIAVFSVREIVEPTGGPEWFTLPVLIAVVICKWAISHRIQEYGDSLESRALQGDAWHHRADAITSAAAGIGILIALIGGEGFGIADDIAALLACGIIIYNGFAIIRRSLDDVLDARVPPDWEKSIRDLADGVQSVDTIEKSRVRKSGIGYFVELHVHVPGDKTVRQGHAIAHEVKELLMREKPQILDVVVHVEPTREK